jgi:hypothetical protein
MPPDDDCGVALKLSTYFCIIFAAARPLIPTTGSRFVSASGFKIWPAMASVYALPKSFLGSHLQEEQPGLQQPANAEALQATSRNITIIAVLHFILVSHFQDSISIPALCPLITRYLIT